MYNNISLKDTPKNDMLKGCVESYNRYTYTWILCFHSSHTQMSNAWSTSWLLNFQFWSTIPQLYDPKTGKWSGSQVGYLYQEYGW